MSKVNLKSIILNHKFKQPRIAIVCDWLTNPGGDDKIIWALHKLFPKAPIFTTVYNGDKMPHYKSVDVFTSYLQAIPFVKTHHQLFVPLMFRALRKFDLSDYNLIISSSHTVGKSITKPKNAKHICYCHTPLRYIWAPKIDKLTDRINLGPLTAPLLSYLKRQDLLSAKSVDQFIANSKTISKRIFDAYKQESIVIYPPVDVKKFAPKYKNTRGDYFITANRLISYKKVDLIVKAFNKNGKKLVVVGSGPELKNLKKIAKPNIKFTGYISNLKYIKLLQGAKAFIFAAYEDFGIVLVEAMASGTPVIAYGKGGATETVIDKNTGVLFHFQSSNAIVKAIKKFEKLNIKQSDCTNQAKNFSLKIFNNKIKNTIKKIYSQSNN